MLKASEGYTLITQAACTIKGYAASDRLRHNTICCSALVITTESIRMRGQTKFC